MYGNKERIREALEKDGLQSQTAKNIAYGTQRMNDLERALRLSKEPYYISLEIWRNIYKGRNRVEKK